MSVFMKIERRGGDVIWVNVAHIVRIDEDWRGGSTVELTNGDELEAKAKPEQLIDPSP